MAKASMRFEINGGPELQRALKAMGKAAAREGLKDVALEALVPMEGAAERRATLGETGKLRGGIKRQIWKASETKVDAEVISTAPHSHLVEYGHRLVKGGRLGKGGRVIGSVPPHPFMRPAFDATKAEVEQRAAREIGDLIERAWNREVPR